MISRGSIIAGCGAAILTKVVLPDRWSLPIEGHDDGLQIMISIAWPRFVINSWKILYHELRKL